MTKTRTLKDRYLMKRLAKYFVQSRKELVFVLFLMLIIMAIEIFLPLMISIMLDDAIAAGDRQLLVILAISIFMTMMLFITIHYIGRWIFAIIGEKAIYNLRGDVFEKVQDHSQDYFDRTPTGETVSRMTNDLNNMQPILDGGVLFAFISLFQMIGYLVVMFSKSVIL